MIGQMLDTFRLPKDFPSLVYLSMVLQAEGIRYGVEHWRRHIDRVAGTLYWQLNDCWPVASWSSLDYFGRWKALHYAARRFYAPLLLSIEDQPASMQAIYVTQRPAARPGKAPCAGRWRPSPGRCWPGGPGTGERCSTGSEPRVQPRFFTADYR